MTSTARAGGLGLAAILAGIAVAGVLRASSGQAAISVDNKQVRGLEPAGSYLVVHYRGDALLRAAFEAPVSSGIPLPEDFQDGDRVTIYSLKPLAQCSNPRACLPCTPATCPNPPGPCPPRCICDFRNVSELWK